jgi:hypothetical protein
MDSSNRYLINLGNRHATVIKLKHLSILYTRYYSIDGLKRIYLCALNYSIDEVIPVTDPIETPNAICTLSTVNRPESKQDVSIGIKFKHAAPFSSIIDRKIGLWIAGLKFSVKPSEFTPCLLNLLNSL